MASKKTRFLLIGGGIVLLIVIVYFLFSNRLLEGAGPVPPPPVPPGCPVCPVCPPVPPPVKVTDDGYPAAVAAAKATINIIKTNGPNNISNDDKTKLQKNLISILRLDPASLYKFGLPHMLNLTNQSYNIRYSNAAIRQNATKMITELSNAPDVWYDSNFVKNNGVDAALGIIFVSNTIYSAYN